VADLVKALEGDEEGLYVAQGASPEVAAIAADERQHAIIWDQLKAGDQFGDVTGSRDGVAIAGRASSAAEIGSRETWHRTGGRSGTLRAVIFGVSDGLVSNLSLVMGVAGASSGNPSFILLAGIAGLLAGAFSMAAGEYISMQSQRELFERQIALERAEMEAMPEEEEAEMAALYRAKGFKEDEAKAIAHRLFEDPERALDQLIREELGLDPDELGAPLRAAGGSFAAFALGAFVPVLPYLLLTGTNAFVASIVLSLAALFLVGAGVSLLTGRGVLFSGFRQVGIGAAAAIVTFVVGSIIGVSVAG
jgi:VIT1/CCC1 family predicted Fe2+/Mn2+ transporter